MAGKKNTPGEEGGVISLTPSAGFDIRKAAKNAVELMENLHQPLVIHLPDIDLEFEVGCTRQQIIDGYNQGLKEQQLMVEASNTN